MSTRAPDDAQQRKHKKHGRSGNRASLPYAKPSTPTADPSSLSPPLKPRRGLLLSLLGILFLWIVALLTMYFATV